MNIIEQNLESIYEIIYSAEYKQELKEIYDYIALHLKENNIAKKLMIRIQEEILRLQYFPRANKVIFQEKDRKLYRLIVKNDIIIL